MTNQKKKKVVFAGLSVCGLLAIGGYKASYKQEIHVGNEKKETDSKVKYFENQISGTISYSGAISYKNLENHYLRITTVAYKDKILQPKLMAVNFFGTHYAKPEKNFDTIDYIDLESGLTQITYYYPDGYSKNKNVKMQITAGEDFTIIEEVSLFDYIVEEGWFQEEYDVNELLEFFDTKVKPKLTTQEETKSR